MKLAYFGIPHFGGTYTVYRSLKAGLLPLGIEVRWLGVSESSCLTIDPAIWADELPSGELVTDNFRTDASLANAMNAHIEKNYDGVFVTILGSRIQTNAIRYLNPRIKRIMIVHTPSPGTLSAARAVAEYVHATVAVSERTCNELVSSYDIDPASTFCIPNAIELDRYRRVKRVEAAPGQLRILSFGRIEEAAKGVYWIPKILAQLKDVNFTLTVAGDGPDRVNLEQRLRPYGSRVTFMGRVPEADIPGLYAAHDIFLMPSRMEGFGQTLVEAMAAGCVPVASLINGVTNMIVSHGEDGLLFKMGRCREAAMGIEKLAADHEQLSAMSHAARQNVSGRFDLATQAAAYAGVIQRVMTAPPPIADPLPFNRWFYPRGLRPGLRTYLPEPVKNLLRTWKERVAA